MKRDDPDRYTLDNLLTKTSRSIKVFNEIAGRPQLVNKLISI